MKIINVILILVLFYSCKREEDLQNNNSTNRHNDYPVDDSLVANYLFQPGTWWVYRDLYDNSRDSIYIQSTDFYTINYTSPPSAPGQGPTYYDFDTYEMKLQGSIHETSKYLLIMSSFETIFNPPWDKLTVFSYDKNTDSTVNNFNRIAYYDSIQIQNNWYYNVAKTKIYTYYNSCCPIPDLDYYYISKEYGIIKKEIANPIDSTYQIYELINSNIIR